MSRNSESVFEVANDAFAVHRPVEGAPNPHVSEVVGIAGTEAQHEVFGVEKGRSALGKAAAPLGFELAVRVKPLVFVARIHSG